MIVIYLNLLTFTVAALFVEDSALFVEDSQDSVVWNDFLSSKVKYLQCGCIVSLNCSKFYKIITFIVFV